jgi:VIT1/CCC1 family predicted Fe2+/Mn2+ transporter
MVSVKKAEKFRSFVFGVEDSLVSTVGLVSGIAVAGMPKPLIILTGAVLIFVEAFSMAVGTLLSDNSEKEFEEHRDIPFKKSLASSSVMFISYLLSGFTVLTPYFFLTGGPAVLISILISVFCLFILGAISAHYSKTSIIKKGFVMVLVGGFAIIVGMAISNLVNRF